MTDDLWYVVLAQPIQSIELKCVFNFGMKTKYKDERIDGTVID